MTHLQLDIRTFISLLCIGNITVASILFAYKRGTLMARTCRQFFSGKLLQALAWGLLALRGDIPDLYSVSGGNSLLLMGFALEVLAVTMTGIVNRRAETLFAILAGGCVLVFLCAADYPAQRVAVASLMTIILYGTASAIIVQTPNASRLRRMVGWFYGFFCLILAVRAGVAAGAVDDFGLLSQHFVQTLAFVMAYLFMLVGGIGFVLLVKEDEDQRLIAAYRDMAKREEQLRLQALVLDQIQDHVTITDLHGMVTYVNRTESDALNDLHDGKIGQHVSAFGESPEADATQQEIVNATLTQGAWNGKVINFRPDGSSLFLHLRTTLVKNDAGQPVAMVGIGTDITEQLQTQQALQQSQRQLTDIIDFLPDAMLAIDQDKRVIIWNQALERMTGIPAEQMLGQGDYAYTIPFYGEARPQLMDLVFLDDQTIAERYPYIDREGQALTTEVFCNALYHQRGAWIFAKASPLYDHTGQIVGAIEIIRDITERKQAEEALRQSQELFALFMRYSPVYVFIKTVTPTESRVLQASQNFQQMIGIAGSDIVGKTMAEIFPPDFAAQITADDWAVVLNGEVLTLDEVFNGRYYTTIKFPIIQGEQTLLAGYTIDITERKRAEAALADALQHISAHMDNSPLAVIEFDTELRIIRWSQEAERLFGWAAGDVLGYRIPDIAWAYPEDVAEIQTKIAAMIKGAESRTSDISRHVRKDGTMVDCAWYHSAIYDTAGKLKSMLCLAALIIVPATPYTAMGRR